MSADIKQFVNETAHQLGFHRVGITAATLNDRYAQAFRRALADDHHADMTYLTRHIEQRLDPKQFFPAAKSIVCLAMNYYQPPPESYNIAMYAWGRDYHRVIRKKLHQLAEQIQHHVGRAIIYRAAVDTAPVLEKALAEQAGLGWIGHNACLINSDIGSFTFLAELFLDIPLEPDSPAKNHCGSCRRCIDACPTHAITTPGQVDARRCISYQTIEHRSHLSADLHNWLFGCDICQRACPFNRVAKPTTIGEFRNHQLTPHIDPAEVLRWNDDQYRTQTADSPANRAPLTQWQRNAANLTQNNV